MAKVIQLIYVEDHRGMGTKEDRHRVVEQYWTLEGELLWERDPSDAVAALHGKVGPLGFTSDEAHKISLREHTEFVPSRDFKPPTRDIPHDN